MVAGVCGATPFGGGFCFFGSFLFRPGTEL